MIIDQLPSVGTPALTDETVTEQGQNLFKVTWQRLLALFKSNTALSELTNDVGFVDQAGAAAAAPVQSVNGMTGAVTVASTPLSSITPKPLGTATPGSSSYASRADHVHAMPSADDVGAMSAWELLWTNASPTSSFAAQTVSLDLSGYDAVLIDVNCAYELPDFGTCFVCTVGRGAFMDVWNPSQNNKYFRQATVASTGVTFGEGYFGTGANNNCAIPYRIYGIKGVNN